MSWLVRRAIVVCSEEVGVKAIVEGGRSRSFIRYLSYHYLSINTIRDRPSSSRQYGNTAEHDAGPTRQIARTLGWKIDILIDCIVDTNASYIHYSLSLSLLWLNNQLSFFIPFMNNWNIHTHTHTQIARSTQTKNMFPNQRSTSNNDINETKI